jgi:Fic family protein
MWFDRFEKIRKNYRKGHRSMPSSMLKKETEIFMVKFTYNTNRIEGSALTLRETANLLEKGITPSEKPTRDIKEAEAHRKLFYDILSFKKDLSLAALLEWHAKLFKDTKPDMAGKVRNYQVGISGSRFEPPAPFEVYVLLKEFFKWYDGSKKKMHPLELAALAHLKFETIHPFGDGNGRIGRILMNFVLNKNGYPMLDIGYEKRNSYYNALERAQVKKDERKFVIWFFGRYIKENKRYLK